VKRDLDLKLSFGIGEIIFSFSLTPFSFSKKSFNSSSFSNTWSYYLLSGTEDMKTLLTWNEVSPCVFLGLDNDTTSSKDSTFWFFSFGINDMLNELKSSISSLTLLSYNMIFSFFNIIFLSDLIYDQIRVIDYNLMFNIHLQC
jgi:hypothetical protein